ncbi:MAG: UvrD-helicase domain-containing protein [Chitinophagaceae bacterium]|jgi:DNA helicase-2/ATP-dependent DNA helicase PcrA|nr:UvrD-helicase domain-containing protein [Chitinophagaceae bacterium]MBK7677984.1 UvrD-helicase domain-containing protein [Chitinophagaceae bacterium]MBK8301299.1 UvrD-helicase domain-containing protein [Chitinophagaceae bacterium]MBK9466181.1 UvrD-helicase domain-containing protein [Chitinophagaceae bacterium]MBK9658371.1 UvrD-helicase domain-containing protein [Chitinophagaceae bacterium]
MIDYLQGLNDRQKEAVLHMDGPIMIVAGAGSGKTKVLTTRVVHLMANGVDAFNILALTFTNKAAKEMKERVEKVLGNGEARNLYIGTFHSVFARILRFEAEKIGYPRNFTIYDTDDAKSVVKTVINELDLDDKHYKPNIVYNRISSAKNALVGPAEYRNDYGLQQEDMRANRPAIGQIYDAYVKRCFKNGAMDFDDLLLKFYELLKNVPESLAKYQHKFKYILIDEYQDTNPAQYEIIKLLGAMHENVCVVGDDAQSIYSFRGATIQNILQFQRDYDDVKLVKLEQNYRSTKSILHVANEVIKNNKGQIEKVLFTENGEGEKIKLVRTMTDNDEGKFVADSIQEQKLRNHYSNKDFAILYRTNAQSRAFEEALRRMGIAYTIYGGISFYQRKEIKDLVAYLRIIVNPRDEEALKRIINYPARGVGKTTIDKLVLSANTNNISMWEVLEKANEFGFRAGTFTALEEFVTMIKSFASMLTKQNAYEVAFHVGKQTNLVKELFNDRSTEGVQRYENIQELLNSIKEWTESPDNEDGELVDKSLASYLQQITLLTDADEKDPDADTVKLMTIHAAKGLEFSCVFAAGLEEMLFPNAMAINTREELEEERRLFYVVVTRAKQRLWITYANTRYRFGQLVQNEPSRFIEEIPEQSMDRSFAGGGSKNQLGGSKWGKSSAFDRMRGKNTDDGESGKVSQQSGTYYNSGADVAKSAPSYLPPKGIPPKVKEHVPSADFTASDTSDLKEGQKVEHQKFGFGEVMKMEGAAHNPIATVKFEHNGEKKIMLNYAKLRILE